MAVSQTDNLELRGLQMDAQKFFGCVGYFAQNITLAGDASGGELTIAIREQDDKSKHSRMFLPLAVVVTHDVNAAASQGQLRVLGKTNPQTDQIEIWIQVEAAIGSRALGRGFDSHVTEVLRAHGWFYPIRAKQTTGSEVELFEMRWIESNPGAAEIAKLEVFGLWDYIKPYR